MNLNIFGKQRVEFCGKNYNTPFDQHKWCNCECLYESCRSSIKLLDEVPMGHSKVRLGNFLKEKPNWSLAKELSDSESEEENPEDEVSCENCGKKLTQRSLLKHIGHTEKCKS